MRLRPSGLFAFTVEIDAEEIGPPPAQETSGGHLSTEGNTMYDGHQKTSEHRDLGPKQAPTKSEQIVIGQYVHSL